MSSTPQEPTPPQERRRAPRRQAAHDTIFQPSFRAGEETWTGLVWNLSTTGVSMLLPNRLEAGISLRGELATLDGRARLPLEFRVAHVSLLETGDYVIGGQFTRALAKEAMRPFLGNLMPDEA